MAPGDTCDIRSIPYLSIGNMSGRFISCLSFHDEIWRMWMQIEPDKFMEVHAWPAESFYFAKKPERQSDFYSYTLNFITQRANFTSAQRVIIAIQDDIFNLSASIAKFDVIFQSSDHRHGAARMAATEFEYVLLVCRSVFDLMQELMAEIWETVTLTDSTARKRSLKKSFADMTLSGDTPRAAGELQERFGLPEIVANTYERHSRLFLRMRKMRDNFVHRGHSVPTIFRSEDGFYVTKESRTFSDLDIWHDTEAKENGLVPMAPLVGMLIEQTLNACDEFADAMMRIIKFPEPIAPNMHLFMRGYFNEKFQTALNDALSRRESGKLLFA